MPAKKGELQPVSAHQLEATVYQEDGWTHEKLRAEVEKRTSVKLYCIVLHDHDVDTHGDPVKPHFHVYMYYGDTSWRYEDVAKWFSIGSHLVRKISSDNNGKNLKRGRYYTIRYYTHMDHPEKHYYPPSGFLANFNVEQYLAEEIAKDTRRNKTAQADSELRDLIDRCVSGEIRPYNYPDKIPPIMYARYAPQFKRAWDMYHAHRIAEAKGSRNCQILWLYGEPGDGKTNLAKLFAEQLEVPLYLTSSGNDPLGKYADEPYIILEEVRPGEGFSYKELLQFLDPFTMTATKSRYYDKVAMADWIVVTSPYSPAEYYKQAVPVSSDIDSAGQLYRRISQVWHVLHDTIEISRYDKDTKTFIRAGTRKNPVPDYLKEIEAAQKPQTDPLDVLAKVTDKYDPAKRQLSIPGMDGA